MADDPIVFEGIAEVVGPGFWASPEYVQRTRTPEEFMAEMDRVAEAGGLVGEPGTWDPGMLPLVLTEDERCDIAMALRYWVNNVDMPTCRDALLALADRVVEGTHHEGDD